MVFFRILLEVGGPAVADLSALRGHTTLRSLTLAGVGSVDLSPLKGLICLDRLEIRRTPSDISQLTGISALNSLILWDAEISNEAAFAGLPSLRSLMLFGCALESLAALQNLSNLEHLTLSRFSGNDLTPLGSLTRIRSLHLHFTRVVDLGWLSDLKAVESLALYGASISDISSLPFFPSLQRLDLRENRIPREQLKTLRRKYPDAKILG